MKVSFTCSENASRVDSKSSRCCELLEMMAQDRRRCALPRLTIIAYTSTLGDAAVLTGLEFAAPAPVLGGLGLIEPDAALTLFGIFLGRFEIERPSPSPFFSSCPTTFSSFSFAFISLTLSCGSPVAVTRYMSSGGIPKRYSGIFGTKPLARRPCCRL